MDKFIQPLISYYNQKRLHMHTAEPLVTGGKGILECNWRGFVLNRSWIIDYSDLIVPG